MQSFVQTSLFKNLSAIFVFVVFTLCLLAVIGGNIFHYTVDPIIRDTLLTGIGYILNQLGSYQGATTAVLSGQATFNTLVGSPLGKTLQDNTVATKDNTHAMENTTQIGG